MFPITLLLICIALGLVLGICKRYSIWSIGKGKAPRVSPLLLLTIPRRYFVDLHHIVMRDRSIAWTHVLVAGASVALCLLLALTLLIALIGNAIPIEIVTQSIGVILAICIVIGSVRLYLRRVGMPAKLSYAAFATMPWSLIAFGCGTCGVLLFDSHWRWASLALALCGGIDIFWSGMLHRPFKHIIAGSAHLAFHSRQERFSNQCATALKPLAFSTTDCAQTQHGVAHASDFTWQQILGFDACIQCGRCQEVCPAFAAGQPLNPKKLIQDCLLSAQGGKNSLYTGIGHPSIDSHDSQHIPQDIAVSNSEITPNLITTNTLFACTTCRACVEACPMMIEHVDAVVDLRRHITLDKGDVPGKGQEVLANLRYTDTQSGNACHVRHHWAVDLSIESATTDTHYDVILLSGEGGFDLRHQQVLRSLTQLIQHTNIRMAVLQDEPDCGDLARRLGDEIGFIRLASKLGARLQALRFSRILTCDPHVYHAIKNEYPALGFSFSIVHHSEFLLELLTSRTLVTSKLNRTITYHDPCYLGRYNDIIDAPRHLLAHIGVHITEMEKSAKQSRCCGWGGGSAFTDIPGKVRIPDMRMADAKKTGADTVAVACPNCHTMLEGVVSTQAQITDIAILVHQAVMKAQAQ